MRDDLGVSFREHLTRENLFPEPGLALVAVSGGPDSLALLHLLHDACPDCGLHLAVAYVDHGIVPQSADWGRMVQAAAEHIGVASYVVRLALGARTSETVARRERYRALRRLQAELDARYLVTAHHADDQVETLLFRFLRGSGPAGLAGIPVRGPRGLIRPLLPFHKREVEAWLRERAPELVVAVDPANADPVNDRSWIRGRALPLLRERYGDLDDRVLRVARQAQDEREAWDAVLTALDALEYRLIDGGVEVARPFLQRYDKTLSVALLRAAARAAGCRLADARARRVLAFSAGSGSGRAMELGSGWLAETAFDRLRIYRPSARPSEVDWGGADHGELRWGGWSIAWSRDAAGRGRRDATTTWMTPGAGIIRGLLPGDRIRPLGGVGRRKVRRVLMEARIPRSERHSYPLVVRDGDILWIPGICRSDAALPNPGEPALRLDARRNRYP